MSRVGLELILTPEPKQKSNKDEHPPKRDLEVTKYSSALLAEALFWGQCISVTPVRHPSSPDFWSRQVSEKPPIPHSQITLPFFRVVLEEQENDDHLSGVCLLSLGFRNHQI